MFRRLATPSFQTTSTSTAAAAATALANSYRMSATANQHGEGGDASGPIVTHEKEKKRFTLRPSSSSASGAECHLDYVVLGGGGANAASSAPLAVDFTHTYVDPSFRGKGYGEVLVKEGLAWARSSGFTDIRASCWYVDKFLKKK